MINHLTRILILQLVFFISPLAVQAEVNPVPASLSVLVEESPERDGKSFTIQGELVGEPLLDSGGVWLNILEDGNPMAVFCSAPLASMAVRLAGGNHGRIGNRIRVEGILRRICPDHGGDLDFHAISCEICGAPKEIQDLPKPEELVLSLLIALAILILTLRNGSHPAEVSKPCGK
ncbi:MAG: hypothetical protein WA705_23840 [Candidatus Ozemobacteraceae bacterium]